MKRLSIVWVSLCAAWMATATATSDAHAQVISTGGAVTFVASPPADVSSNNWESNTLIRAFAERQALTLSQDVMADITAPGTSPGASDQNLSAGTITAGAIVDSYTLHFDVNGSRATNDALETTGTITFGRPILGLLVLSTTQNNTNALLGLPGETYSSGPDHGLELTPGGGGTSDVITLSSDRRTITLDLHNASFADDLRVVTTAPEPGLAALLAGLGMVLTARRRRSPRRR
jgi:hypothetical protein